MTNRTKRIKAEQNKKLLLNVLVTGMLTGIIIMVTCLTYTLNML